MKLYKWLDKKQDRYCRKIIFDFYFNSGNRNTLLTAKFVKLYVKRLLFLFLDVLFLRKRLWVELFRSLFGSSHKINSLQDLKLKYNRLNELLFRTSGLGHFVSFYVLPLLPTQEILNRKISLPRSENPIVSIIIPVYNQLSYTYNCLLSLRKHLPAHIPIEIVVIDDHSTDETEAFLSANTEGIIYLRRDVNSGFLSNCNLAVKHSKGKFICLLNNDTQIRPGWLEKLMSAIDENPSAGLVGSKLLFQFGLVQEAGGIIFQDGTTARHGSLATISESDVNQLKDVDYISGASILLLKSDFEDLKGFDPLYSPAYYEDTDLCMNIKHKLNKRVIYVPKSEVIHFEGISSKKEKINQRMEVNKKKFSDKWNPYLKEYSC